MSWGSLLMTTIYSGMQPSAVEPDTLRCITPRLLCTQYAHSTDRVVWRVNSLYVIAKVFQNISYCQLARERAALQVSDAFLSAFQSKVI